MAGTIDLDEIETRSSTLDEIRFSSEQESQTIGWDWIILDHYLDERRRFEHISRLFKSINRLKNIQGGWWEFTSSPDAIVQLGETKYFIDIKYTGRTPPIASALSEITTRDAFQQNLITFFHTRFDEESSIISTLKERLSKDIAQSRFYDTFIELISSRKKKFLDDKCSALRGSPQAVLQAMDASPRPSEEDVDDLLAVIKEYGQSIGFDSPLDE